jgi:hypothetical protein
MVEHFPAATPDPPLRRAILPGRLNARALDLQASGLQQLDYLAIEFRVMVQNDIPVSARCRKRFAELLHHPITGRMGSHIEMQNSSAPVLNDKQTVQKLKRDCRYGKEIERDDYFTMVVKKGQPALAGIPTATNCSKVTCDSPFGDLKAEHQKFAVDFRCSPGWILSRETTD